MVFKTKEEKERAILGLPSEPAGAVSDLDAWQQEQDNKRRELEEATIEPEGEVAGASPQETVSEPTTEPEESDILNFTLKRDELPDELRGYRSPGEIIKQFAHARKYANQTEEKVTSLDEENRLLKERLDKLIKESERATLPIIEQTPVSPAMPSAIDELEESIRKLETMDQEDYLTYGQSKKLFGEITGKVKDALTELTTVKKDIEKQKNEFGQFRSVYETSNKKVVEDEQKTALTKSLEKLQATYPELKTKKAVINASDCVENDVYSFAKKVLGGLYKNYSPQWQHVSAITNAYLRGDPAIVKYCEENAITPESIGSSKEDIQNYVIIHNVHERSRGNKVNPDGTVENLKNPYTGDKVSYRDHVDAYKSFKEETGIASKEMQQLIAEAEKRAQLNLSNAMSRRAMEPVTLGSAGEGSPDDIGEGMSESQARELLADRELEVKIETQARAGNRTLFHKVNQALKRLKVEPFDADPSWPPEGK